MSDLTTAVQAIRQALEKATPGPWKVQPREPGATYLRVRGAALGHRFKVANVLCSIWREDGDADEHPAEAAVTNANAALIVAANPAALRLILDALEEKEAQLAQAMALLRELIDIEGPQPGTAAWAEKTRAFLSQTQQE